MCVAKKENGIENKYYRRDREINPDIRTKASYCFARP